MSLPRLGNRGSPPLPALLPRRGLGLGLGIRGALLGRVGLSLGRDLRVCGGGFHLTALAALLGGRLGLIFRLRLRGLIIGLVVVLDRAALPLGPLLDFLDGVGCGFGLGSRRSLGFDVLACASLLGLLLSLLVRSCGLGLARRRSLLGLLLGLLVRSCGLGLALRRSLGALLGRLGLVVVLSRLATLLCWRLFWGRRSMLLLGQSTLIRHPAVGYLEK